MIVSTKIEYITPDIARGYLDRNYEKNRRIRKSWLKSLATMMADGSFHSLNGQNRIIFGTDGKMYDGQHRMLAICLSGVTLPFEVCVSDSASRDYATFDYAQSKRASDFGGTNNSCSIAMRMFAIEYGVSPLLTALQGRIDTSTPVPRIDTTNYLEANKELVQKITAMATKIRTSLNCGGITTYGSFLFLLQFVHDDLYLESFVDDLVNPSSNNKTVNVLRALIMKSYLSKNKPTSPWLLGVLLCAYSHYKRGDDTTMINKPAQYIERYSKMMIQERQERSEEKAA